MAYPGYYGSQYASDFDYNDHDRSPVHDEYFPDLPRSQPSRHATHSSFSHFNGNEFQYSDPQYVTQMAPRYAENYQPTPVTARPVGDHRSSYSSGSSPVSRHSEPRPLKPASRSPSPEDQRAYCSHPSCMDPNGRPLKSFSRKADVARHMRSAHERRYIDCPRKNCVRKGDQGFTRNDHLVEHRRQFHMEDIPKKGGARDGGGAASGGRKGRHSA